MFRPVLAILFLSVVHGFAPMSLFPSLRTTSLRGRVSTIRMKHTSEGGTPAVAPSVGSANSVRNVGFVGHSHSGKTALVEWMLYDEAMLSRKPSNGAFTLDYDAEEKIRHASVFSHFARVPHRDSLLEIVDTPWGDFPSDAIAALDGSDAAVLVVSAASGVQPGAVHAFEHCKKANLKVLVAVNKMDRPYINTEGLLNDMETSFGIRPIPIQVPVGEGEDFEGVKQLILLGKDGKLEKTTDRSPEVTHAWAVLEEAVAMTDDTLLTEYLESMQLKPDQVIQGLKKAVLAGKTLPLVYTSAEKNLGVTELMDSLLVALPSPIEARAEALERACEEAGGSGAACRVPDISDAFLARVVHTSVDAFGQLSVLRVIANGRDGEGMVRKEDQPYAPVPSEVVVMRTGEKVRLASAANTVALVGKDRLPLSNGGRVVPGEVIAMPKLPETIKTNDILVDPCAYKVELEEVDAELNSGAYTPLSREPEITTPMAAATLTVPEDKKKGGKGKGGAGDDKLRSALDMLVREDLSLSVQRDQASGSLLLWGMSTEHLKVAAERLKTRHGIEVELGTPPVMYKETISKAVSGIEGRHKKQSGGAGQFGVCVIDIEPIGEGMGVEFVSKIKGGVIPKAFIGSVEKGVREALAAGGPLAGYPVTDVRVTLVDGKTHPVDSKDIAFQGAGRLAVKAALGKAGTKLLQPVEEVEFSVPEAHHGDVNSMIIREGGFVSSSSADQASGFMQISAIMPQAVMQDAAEHLRALSQGQGVYTSKFSHYEPLTGDKIKEVIEASPYRHNQMEE